MGPMTMITITMTTQQMFKENIKLIKSKELAQEKPDPKSIKELFASIDKTDTQKILFIASLEVLNELASQMDQSDGEIIGILDYTNKKVANFKDLERILDQIGYLMITQDPNAFLESKGRYDIFKIFDVRAAKIAKKIAETQQLSVQQKKEVQNFLKIWTKFFQSGK